MSFFFWDVRATVASIQRDRNDWQEQRNFSENSPKEHVHAFFKLFFALLVFFPALQRHITRWRRVHSSAAFCTGFGFFFFWRRPLLANANLLQTNFTSQLLWPLSAALHGRSVLQKSLIAQLSGEMERRKKSFKQTAFHSFCRYYWNIEYCFESGCHDRTVLSQKRREEDLLWVLSESCLSRLISPRRQHTTT